MARRYYSSTAARTTLASGVNDSTTTFTVAAVSGWPSSFPYTLIIDQDTINEEIVEVTARSGTTLTVTRGVDGTTGVAHDAGAAVNHGVSARDFDEPNAFINGTDFINPSIVTAKGDIIAATGNGAVDNVAVGSDGTVLVADSGSSTGVAWAGMESPNRNLLYNGAMQVHQRGTSQTAVNTTGYYTLDRWRHSVSTTAFGEWTDTVENDAPTGSGLAKSWKTLCTTAQAAPAAGSALAFNTLLEGQDVQRIKKGTASAEQLSASFWVKSNVTGTYIVELIDADNSRRVSASYTISASATWERKTITFPADTTGVLDNDNNNSLGLQFWLGAGSNFTTGTLATTWHTSTTNNRAVGQTNLADATNNYWQITGVQLEVGDTATEFEFKSYGQELAECQRYYQLRVSGSGKGFWNAVLYNTTSIYGVVDLPVTMRIPPTLSIVTGSNYYAHLRNNASDTFDAFVIDNATENAVELSAVALISGTAGQGGWVRTNNASSFVAFQAEL